MTTGRPRLSMPLALFARKPNSCASACLRISLLLVAAGAMDANHRHHWPSCRSSLLPDQPRSALTLHVCTSFLRGQLRGGQASVNEADGETESGEQGSVEVIEACSEASADKPVQLCDKNERDASERKGRREFPEANSKTPGFTSVEQCRAALRSILDRPGCKIAAILSHACLLPPHLLYFPNILSNPLMCSIL
jgi:hypothetical protein